MRWISKQSKRFGVSKRAKRANDGATKIVDGRRENLDSCKHFRRVTLTSKPKGRRFQGLRPGHVLHVASIVPSRIVMKREEARVAPRGHISLDCCQECQVKMQSMVKLGFYYIHSKEPNTAKLMAYETQITFALCLAV